MLLGASFTMRPSNPGASAVGISRNGHLRVGAAPAPDFPSGARAFSPIFQGFLPAYRIQLGNFQGNYLPNIDAHPCQLWRARAFNLPSLQSIAAWQLQLFFASAKEARVIPLTYMAVRYDYAWFFSRPFA
jgi:hypothetical protein